MQYLWLFLLILTGSAMYFTWRRIRFDHFYKLVIRGMLKRKQPENFSAYFSSAQLQKITTYLLKQRNKAALRSLFYLCFGKTAAAEDYLKNKHEDLKYAALRSFGNYEEGIRLFSESEALPEAKAELAELYFLTGHRGKTNLILQNIPKKRVSQYVRAKKYYYMAQQYLNDGNMLSASEYAGLAASLFKKSKAYVEEGKAYLLAGTIYRVSAVEDVAHFMFTQAGKIFDFLKYPAGKADALGNLGMLWTMQERFDDAENYFVQSLEINQSADRPEAAAAIKNQLALLYLLKKEYPAAEKTALEALDVMERQRSRSGQAFSREILAYIYSQSRNWKALRQQALLSAEIYDEYGDTSSYLECLYLKAIGEYELGNSDASETDLRKIIEISQNKASCFHVGNAYNLLGLIFLKQNDLPRAKGLFLQSAAWEQKEERFSGAATDYANIGLIEYKIGNKEQALRTYETALDYASAFSETELSGFLRSRIEELKAELE